MKQHVIEPILEEISAEIRDFTVGFAKLNIHDKIEEADLAGSGSLVTVGSVHGVLTAAHVLTGLPKKGEVGLIRFPRKPVVVSEKLVIEMDHADSVIIRSSPFGPGGPDIGILLLSPEDVERLTARGNVFYNLGTRRDAILAGDLPDPSYFDGISGVVAEWTSDLPPEKGSPRIKGFHALFGAGVVVKEHQSNGFDLLDFEVTYRSGSVSPLNYKGVSGGAVWRVYGAIDDDGKLSVTGKKLYGVAFHQSCLKDEKRIITCHGPRSVYGSLIDAIRERWSG